MRVAVMKTKKLSNQKDQRPSSWSHLWTLWIILSMIISPMPHPPFPFLTAQAQEDDRDSQDEGPPEFEQKQSDQAWGTVMQSMSQITQMYSAIQQQQAMQAQMMAKMTQFISESQPQAEPSKFFPACQLAKPTKIPHGYCEGTPNPMSGGEMKFNEMGFFKMVADKNVTIYTDLLREDQNKKILEFNQGTAAVDTSAISCLEQNKKLVESQMQDKLDHLAQLISQVEKDSQKEKQNLKDMLTQMKRISEELEGGSEDSLFGKGINFQNMLRGSGCEDTLTSAVLKGVKSSANGKYGGLRGMIDFMDAPKEGDKSIHDQSNEMIRKEGQIIKQVQNQMARLQKEMTQYGVSVLDPKNSSALMNKLTRGGMMTFGAMQSIIENNGERLFDSYSIVESEWKNFKHGKKEQWLSSLPEVNQLNKTGMRNLENLQSQAKEVFKKRFLDDCMQTTALDRFKHVSTDGNSSTDRKYRMEVKKIFEDESYPVTYDSDISKDSFKNKPSKRDLIKKMNNNNITMVLNGPFQGKDPSYRWTLLEYYDARLGMCLEKFNHESIPGSNSSLSRAIEVFQNSIGDFKKQVNITSSEIANEVQGNILNCKDTGSETIGNCSSDRYDTAKNDFCLTTAMTCAGKVRNCYGKVTSEIKAREQLVKGLQTTFNTSIENIIAAQEAQYQQMKGQILQDSKLLSKYFEGAGVNLSEILGKNDKLFVAMPELADEKEFGVGVQLRGDKNFQFFDNLPNALKTLQKAIEEQKQQLISPDSAIAKHIEAQKQVLEENKQTWQDFSYKCEEKMNDYISQVTRMNQEMMEQNRKQSEGVSDACNPIDALDSSAAPGCDDKDRLRTLYEDAISSSNQINPTALQRVGAWSFLLNRHCANTQNNKTKFGQEDDLLDDPVRTICGQDFEEDYEEGLQDFINKQYSSLPSDQAKKIDQFIDNDEYDTNIIKDLPSHLITMAKTLRLLAHVEMNSPFSSILGTEMSKPISDTDGQFVKAVKSYRDELFEKDATDATSQAKEGVDVCQLLKAEAKINKVLKQGCTVSSSADSKGCDGIWKTAEIKESDEGLGSNATSINNKLLKVQKTALYAKAQGIDDQWKRIGEQYAGRCSGGNQDPRGMSGLFPKGQQGLTPMGGGPGQSLQQGMPMTGGGF